MKMDKKWLAALTVLPLLLSVAALGQFYKLKVYGAGVGLSTPLIEADINHDGRPDVLGLSFHDSVTVFLGDGKGGSEAPKTTAITGVDNPQFPAVGDFNDDDNPDVFLWELSKCLFGERRRYI
jgi:FG-GAP-like repeat